MNEFDGIFGLGPSLALTIDGYQVEGDTPGTVRDADFHFTADALRARIAGNIDRKIERAKANGLPRDHAIKLSLSVHGISQQIEMFMRSFPPRHRRNLAKTISAEHPAWMRAFNAVYAKLGTGSIIVLTGAWGTGKTQMATALARKLVEESATTKGATAASAKYWVLAKLFTSIKETFSPSARNTEWDILDDACHPDLLVLDECHEISGTDWQGRILTLLVNDRYQDLKDTILITNESELEFAEAVGPSIASRLEECGVFVACDWPSFRRIQGE